MLIHPRPKFATTYGAPKNCETQAKTRNGYLKKHYILSLRNIHSQQNISRYICQADLTIYNKVQVMTQISQSLRETFSQSEICFCSHTNHQVLEGVTLVFFFFREFHSLSSAMDCAHFGFREGGMFCFCSSLSYRSANMHIRNARPSNF
jgi:hypothetical protein